MSAILFAQSALKRIDEQVAGLTEQMADGRPTDWEGYRFMVGQRRGLLLARETITERFSQDDRASFQLDQKDD